MVFPGPLNCTSEGQRCGAGLAVGLARRRTQPGFPLDGVCAVMEVSESRRVEARRGEAGRRDLGQGLGIDDLKCR